MGMQVSGLILAGLSAVFGGVSVAVTKAGMGKADVYWVNALSNTIILMMFALAALSFGSPGQWRLIESWPLLIASGFFLGISWVFYYLGLKDGPVGTVLALQNLSIIITMGLSAILLKEHISGFMAGGAVLMGIGTVLMTEKAEKPAENTGRRWIAHEVLSAVCISISFVLTKLDASPVDSNLSSAVRYLIVAVMMWGLYLEKGSRRKGGAMAFESNGEDAFGGGRLKITVGAVLLGGGYILFYKALAIASVNLVTTIFRMSMILSTILSALFLGEAMPLRKQAGIAAMAVGLGIYVM